VRALLEQYVPRVYRFALRLAGDRHQAEDLTQETFVRAWRSREHLRDREAVRAWLFKIAANLWRDRVRRARRAPRRMDPSCEDHQSTDAPPERIVADREDLGQALEIMNSLPPRQREVLYLHACEEFSVTEIAGILEISADAVKASLSLARKRMRRQLGDICRDRFPTS
jgi:RNA polymerase sigma-70 factor (ECF subfamily)